MHRQTVRRSRDEELRRRRSYRGKPASAKSQVHRQSRLVLQIPTEPHCGKDSWLPGRHLRNEAAKATGVFGIGGRNCDRRSGRVPGGNFFVGSGRLTETPHGAPESCGKQRRVCCCQRSATSNFRRPGKI